MTPEIPCVTSLSAGARHDLAQLREISLGVTVFGRASATFDPARDSIVRVEARRLRARLARYYANEGAHDAVRITLASGSYIPGVEHLNAATERVGAGIADVDLILRPDGDSGWQEVMDELRFPAGVRGINVAAESTGNTVDERLRYVVTPERIPSDEAGEAAIALRLASLGRISRLKAAGDDHAASSVHCDRMQRPLSATARATLLLGVGLAAGWCPQAPAVTPRYLDDEVSRDCYHRAELAFRQRSIAGYDGDEDLRISACRRVEGAEIHAGLARCCVALAGMIAMPVREAMPLAREHAELALALDAGLRAAYCVVAQVANLHDRQWDTGLRHYPFGIQRCPRHAPLHHGFAFALMYRATLILPIGPSRRRSCSTLSTCKCASSAGWCRTIAATTTRRYVAGKTCLPPRPEHLLASTLVGAAHLAAGRPQQALSYYHSACDRQPQHPIGNAGLAQAFAMLGDEAKAREQLLALEHKASGGYVAVPVRHGLPSVW